MKTVAYIKWVLETAETMLPDEYSPGIVATEDDWVAAISAGKMLVQLGVARVEEFEQGQKLLERSRAWLVELLRQGALNRLERVEAGDVLDALGDPRFCPDMWFLPNEPLLGFVRIPEGPFIMGELDEQHEVYLPTFYIARYPVTKAQFKAFVLDTGFTPEDKECMHGPNNHPVVWITWYEALEYCRWLSKKLKQLAVEKKESTLQGVEKEFWTGLGDEKLTVTLPSEAEWEKAARGPKGRRYPWGREKPDLDRANYGAAFGEPAIGGTSPVGCFPRGATPEGVYDLAGNVWEYTRTIFGKDPFARKEGWIRSYVPRWWTRSLRQEKWLGPEFPFPPYNPTDGRENLEAGPEWDRGVRGGSWTVDARRLRCTFRDALPPTNRHSADGFRVVVSPGSTNVEEAKA